MEKNKILMVVIIVLLVVLLGAMAFLGVSAAKYMKGMNEPVKVQTVTALSLSDIVLVKLEKPINANLRVGTDNVEHIGSFKISIGVDSTNKKESPLMVALVTEKESVIRDRCLNIVRSKTYEELKRQDGPDILRQEILTQLQQDFASNLIYQVYIEEMITE